MKCSKCGKKLKSNEEHFIGGENRIGYYIREKPGFYCWPCWKEKQKERWTPLFIMVVIFLIIVLIYVLFNLFGTNKKNRQR